VIGITIGARSRSQVSRQTIGRVKIGKVSRARTRRTHATAGLRWCRWRTSRRVC